MQPLEIPKPTLRPKLEWMLLSHQVSQAELAEALVREYYLSIYRRVLPHVNGPQDANLVSRRALRRAIERAYTYRIGQGVRKWIEEITNDVCQVYLRRQNLTNSITSIRLDIPIKGERVRINPIPADVTKLNETQIQFITAAVLSSLRTISLRRKFARIMLWVTLAGLGLALLVLFNLSDVISTNGSGALPTRVQRESDLQRKTENPRGVLPSPVNPETDRTPLTSDTSSEEIIQFVRGNSDNLSNLWADGLVIDYGPRGYRGPAIVQREQLWLSPPGNSRVLTGSLREGKPDRLWVTMSGRVIKEDENGDAWEQYIGSGLIEYTDFRPLLRPAFAHFKEGRSIVLGEEVVAGRDTIVLDYFLRNGRHEGRYSIDVHTGIGLRLRRYTDNSLSWVREERLITEIEYNVEMSPNLFRPTFQRPLVYTSGPLGLPETHQTRLSNILVDGIGGRSLLPKFDNYEFFTSASLDLTFQFVEITRLGARQDIADIYAGSHYLGSVAFDDPWRVQCSRSPDGNQVAFYAEAATYTDEPTPLRWFSLDHFGEVHSPNPKIIPSSNPAFSPDSSHLAVSGCSSTSEPECGLFLVDLETHTAEQLIDLQGASSLIWSPEGDQIAFLGGSEGDPEWQIYILDSETGEVLYKDRVSTVLENIRPRSDSPLADWGVRFPVNSRGLRDCVSAPQSGAP